MKLAWVAIALGAGCTGDIMSGVGGDDEGDGTAAVRFTSPAPGSSHVRDVLADSGWLVAAVPVSVEVEGADAVEIVAGDLALGAVDGAGDLTAELRAAGETTLTARALRDGEVVAEAALAVTVTEPAAADCHAWLDLYGLDWEPIGATQGVEDPITVRIPVNGVPYRYVANEAARESFTVMDCSLARSLAEAAPMLRERGVAEVADIGVYNYRCIGGGTPPDCPNGISQHAYAKAIDLAGFTLESGEYYSVETDWVIDADDNTCGAEVEPGADTWLHETICALKGAGVWNIVLTPNFNDAHRDHFHVDLTAGADFIERHGGVDHGPDGH